MSYHHEYPPEYDDAEPPAAWDLAEMIRPILVARHSEWRDRGNRSDYIACDCGKDADLDGLSTGILSLYAADDNIMLRWGWLVTFCYGEGLTDEQAEQQWEIACGSGLDGKWDGDTDSMTGSGEEDVCIDGIAADILGDDWREIPANDISKAQLESLADAIWDRFCLERKQVEQAADETHAALSASYESFDIE